MRRALAVFGVMGAFAAMGSAARASAAAAKDLPASLQQLLRAAKSLRPRHLVIEIEFVEPYRGRIVHFRDRFAATDGRAFREEIRLTAPGYGWSDMRSVGADEYDRGTRLEKLVGHRWVSQYVGPSLRGTAGVTALYRQAVLHGLNKKLTEARSVQQVGPVVVAGRPATAFSLMLPAGVGKTRAIVLDLAADGEILSEAGTANGVSYRATLSIDEAVTITRPAVRETIALSALPKRDRARTSRAIESQDLIAGGLVSASLGLF